MRDVRCSRQPYRQPLTSYATIKVPHLSSTVTVEFSVQQNQAFDQQQQRD